MNCQRYIQAALIGAGLVCLTVAAQSPETFKGRLAPVPIDAQTRANIAGVGSVSAVLAGARLTVTGSFEGLRSPATAAQIHQGTATGVHGPAVFDLTVTKAAGGTISGSVELTPQQIESLKKGRLYVQIASEKAPDGNLWGWLLK